MPHGVSFNYSIWFVELKGVVSWDVVHPAHKWLTKYREKEAVRLCLKHFRQHNYSEAFESLQVKMRAWLQSADGFQCYSLLDRREIIVKDVTADDISIMQKKTKVPLEHPLLTKLHKTLVEAGNYEETENCIKQDCENGKAFLALETWSATSL